MITGLIAKLGLGILWGKLKKVPRWVWLTLAVVITVALLFVAHQRHAEQMITDAYARGANDKAEEHRQELAEARREANRWRLQYQTKSEQLSALERTQHEQALTDNAARADSLRLRGPGAAASCPRRDDTTGLPVTAGDNEQGAGPADATGLGMPADQWASVPWAWLVRRAEEFDANRDEVLRWRNWYATQSELYEASRKELAEASN